MLINYVWLSHYESLACWRPLPRHYTQLSCSQSPSEPREQQADIPSLTCEPANHRRPIETRLNSPRHPLCSEAPPSRAQSQPAQLSIWSICRPIRRLARLAWGADSALARDKHRSHDVTATRTERPDLFCRLAVGPAGRGGRDVPASGWPIYCSGGAGQLMGISALTDQQ